MSGDDKLSPFVSGSLPNAVLHLTRSDGSTVACPEVIICLGTLNNNNDATSDIEFSE